MSPTSRARVTELAVATAFAATAAWLFVAGDDRGGSLPLFLGWAGVHVLYGAASGSFLALLVAVTCPPLLVATAGDGGGETPLWLQALFVELFYGVAFTFLGVVGRRLWRARRPRPE